MKEIQRIDILGGKHTLDSSYIFTWGQYTPNPRTYAPRSAGIYCCIS